MRPTGRARAILIALLVGRGFAGGAPAQTVPVVGCESTGQVQRPAPAGSTLGLPIPAAVAGQVAYYVMEGERGVLAPRNWHCVGLIGSSGATLYVTPQKIDRATSSGLTGYGIVSTRLDSGASGRIAIAEIISRVFPSYKAIAAQTASDFDSPPEWLSAGPYPADLLRYRSNECIEYTTPPNTIGLGTFRGLSKSSQPIRGVVALKDRGAELRLLAIRLASTHEQTASAVVRQFLADLK